MTMVVTMDNTVSKSKLKAKMLEYFRKVEETGEPLIVTNHGKPVLEVRPYRSARKATPQEVFGHLWGTIELPDDDVLNEPIVGLLGDSEFVELLK